MAKYYKKFDSKKFTLSFIMMAVVSIAAIFPPILTFFINNGSPLIILNGTEFVSALSAILLFYNGSDVMQKKFENKQTEHIEVQSEK